MRATSDPWHVCFSSLFSLFASIRFWEQTAPSPSPSLSHPLPTTRHPQIINGKVHSVAFLRRRSLELFTLISPGDHCSCAFHQRGRQPTLRFFFSLYI
jgi:hypothetical protein